MRCALFGSKQLAFVVTLTLSCLCSVRCVLQKDSRRGYARQVLSGVGNTIIKESRRNSGVTGVAEEQQCQAMVKQRRSRQESGRVVVLRCVAVCGLWLSGPQGATANRSAPS